MPEQLAQTANAAPCRHAAPRPCILTPCSNPHPRPAAFPSLQFVFRQGSPLDPAALRLVAAQDARAIIVSGDNRWVGLWAGGWAGGWVGT